MSHSTETIRREAERILKAAGATGAPVSLRNVVSHLNLSLVERRREPFGSEAALVARGDGHAIELRGSSSERRLRFTIAHEIGHFLLHPGRAVAERGGVTNQATARLEREADQFAAELLMPEAAGAPGGPRRRRRRAPSGRPLRRQLPGHEPASAPPRPCRTAARPRAALAQRLIPRRLSCGASPRLPRVAGPTPLEVSVSAFHVGARRRAPALAAPRCVPRAAGGIEGCLEGRGAPLDLHAAARDVMYYGAVEPEAIVRDVNVGRKFLAEYQSIIFKELLSEIKELAAPLQGKRVLHVNATSFGGGVAEILYTLLPLMNDVGLQAEWQVMTADSEFFNVTKAFHNGLQGAPVELTDDVRAIYEDVNRRNAAQLTRRLRLRRDPRPAAVRHAHLGPRQGRDGTRWIWRCHIDTSTPDRALYDYLLPFIRRYDRAIYTMASYAPDGLGVPLEVVPPAIDPLAPKNMTLVPDDAHYIVRQFGIDVDRPLLLQVSRFDPWKDPLGVVDAYRQVKARWPSRAARADRFDGVRRPRGLGLPREAARLRGRRPRRLRAVQPRQHRQRRGQRVPVACRGRAAKVDARGLRPHRQRGPLEGAPRGRRRRGGHPPPDRRRRHRLPGRVERGLRRTLPRDPRPARSRPTPWRVAARSTCASTS